MVETGEVCSSASAADVRVEPAGAAVSEPADAAAGMASPGLPQTSQ